MTNKDALTKSRSLLQEAAYTGELAFSLMAVLTDGAERIEDTDMKNCLRLLTDLTGDTLEKVNEAEELICNSKA